MWCGFRLLLEGLLETCKEFKHFFGFVHCHLSLLHIILQAFALISKSIIFLSDLWLIFPQIRLRDHGVLDFDAGDARRQPPVDTTWQQVVLISCLILYHPERIHLACFDINSSTDCWFVRFWWMCVSFWLFFLICSTVVKGLHVCRMVNYVFFCMFSWCPQTFNWTYEVVTLF